MLEVPPCFMTELTPFPALPFSTATVTTDIHNTFGHISKDGSWAWIARGSVLEIFSTKSKERWGIWYFGASSKNGPFVITAIEELCSSYLPFPCLVVGLDSADGGLICLFNVKASKVISAVGLPYKVTTLEIVSGTGGATMETHLLHSQLRFFFGIVAVGTEGGNILLIDLCLDEENGSNENAPNKASIINKQTQNLPSKRELAIVNQQHLSIFLNDNSFTLDMFQYWNNRKVLSTFPSDDVIVSSMKYLRNLAVLVVGFNFGGIQLWNLQHLRIEFSLPNHSNQPLVHFAFQEPENDPRNFCYLWAISGHYQGENYRPEYTSVATLYSFAYEKREWVPHYGYFYQNLESCTKRLEYALSNDPYSSVLQSLAQCSRLITCEVVPQTNAKLEAEDTLQGDEFGCTEDSSLCMIAWEVWPITGERPVSSCLVLFDINQWYQAQMPSSIRRNSGKSCSYLGVFILREVSSKMNMDSIVAISVVPNSVSPFKCLTMSEEMFFPSSFAFKIWCLSSESLLQASYLGLQRQVLLKIDYGGPSMLVDPEESYNCCLMGGLLTHINDFRAGNQLSTEFNTEFIGKESESTPVKTLTIQVSEKALPLHEQFMNLLESFQREALLNVALENNLICFLHMCVRQWKNAEFLHSGCSSKLLLDWVWKTVTQIKASVDKLCVPLFNCSGQALDEKTIVTFHTYESRLRHLSEIVLEFQNLPGPKTESGQQELQLKKTVIDSIAHYLHKLIWLCDCKLLPEHEEGCDYGEDEVAYPTTIFQKTYAYRRSELQKIHSSVGLTDLLLIDGLVNEFGPSLVQMWEKKGGSRVYPPPSLYAAVCSYLVDGATLSQKHALMYYLLLDLTAYLADRQAHLLENLTLFCSSNDVSPSLCKLTQAFWQLDHCDFETALNSLLDPMISSVDISPWQHQRILKSLLYQGQAQKALTYMYVRKPTEHTADDVKLHLSILLSNGLISDAFNYQREHQNGSNAEYLLKHLFLGCQETHSLHELLQLPLNILELNCLSEYLLTCADPRAPEILVMFNLLRSCPLEAATLNEKLVTQMMERNVKSRERAAARNALVMGFVDTLPEEQKKLAQELNQVYPRIEKREIPKPLSTSVTTKSLKVVSYADLLRDIIAKVKEASNVECEQMESSFKSSTNLFQTTPFVCTPCTPKGKKRKRPSDTIFATPFTKKSVACTENYTTPAKKPRSFNVSSFKLIDSEYRPSKTSLSHEVLSLLQTPPVCRMTPKTSSSRKVSSALRVVPQPVPHSILKIKSVIQKPASPHHNVCVHPKLSTDTEMEDNVFEVATSSQDDNHSRHLRFRVPTPEFLEPQYQPVKISGRKPLREDSETYSNSQNTSVTNEENRSHPVAEKCDPQVESESDDDKSFHSLSERATSNDDFSLHVSDSESETGKDLCCNPEVPRTSFQSFDQDIQVIHSSAKTDSSELSSANIVNYKTLLADQCQTTEDKWTKRVEELSDSKNRETEKMASFCSNLELTYIGNRSVARTVSVTVLQDHSTDVSCEKRTEEIQIMNVDQPKDKDEGLQAQHTTLKNLEGQSSISRTVSEEDRWDSFKEISSDELSEEIQIMNVDRSKCDDEELIRTAPVESSVDQSEINNFREQIEETSKEPQVESMNEECIIKVVEERAEKIHEVQTEKQKEELVENMQTSDTVLPKAIKETEKNHEIELHNEVHLAPPEIETYPVGDSPYLGTRSRSKSISPSRTASSKPKPSKHSPTSKKDTSVVLKQREEHMPADVIPHFETLKPAVLVEEHVISSSPYLGTRSRSRSKSPSLSPKKPTYVPLKSSPILSSTPLQDHSKDERQSIEEKTKSNVPNTWIVEREVVKEVSYDSREKIPVSFNLDSTASNNKKGLSPAKRMEPLRTSTPESNAEEQVNQISAASDHVADSKQKTSIKAQIKQFLKNITPPSAKKKTEKSEAEKPDSETDKKKFFSTKKKLIKKKNKGRTSQKLEFSFSEPHSSANAEIIEALAKSPVTPVASFVFSPPLTRARVRQKKLSESMNASMMSSTLNASVTRSKKTIFDPLLEDDSDILRPVVPTEPSSSQIKKKPITKTKRYVKGLPISTSISDINVISPVTPNPRAEDSSKSALMSSFHSMKLRKSKTKRKTVKLF